MRWNVTEAARSTPQYPMGLPMDIPSEHVNAQLNTPYYVANSALGQRRGAMPVDVSALNMSGRYSLPAEQYWSPKQIAGQIHRYYGKRTLNFFQRTQKMFSLATMAMTAALQGENVREISKILGKDTPNSRKLAQSIKALAVELKKDKPDLDKVRKLSEKAQWRMAPAIARSAKERDQIAKYLRWAHGIHKPGSRPYTGQGPLGGAVDKYAPGATEIAPGTFKARGASETGLKALAAARSQLGVREATGKNDGVPSRRYMNGRKEPWCANFIAWAFQQTGMPLPGNQRSLASVQYMEDQMKKAGKFTTGTPKPGDIIFFKNRGASDRGNGRHVGIVEKVENGIVYTIEGNTSNSVARRQYSLSNGRISGYGRA